MADPLLVYVYITSHCTLLCTYVCIHTLCTHPKLSCYKINVFSFEYYAACEKRDKIWILSV
jgi:hypothetical protein